MLRLYVKDNTSGRVHEYGTNQHDALILQDDGSLHYENLQCCTGTMFPEEGYSFCNEDGTIPKWDKEYGAEPYIDIGGEFYNKPITNADRIRAMGDEELAEFLAHINPTNCQDCAFSHGWRCQPDRDDYSDFEKCKEGRKRWLQQPAEGE